MFFSYNKNQKSVHPIINLGIKYWKPQEIRFSILKKAALVIFSLLLGCQDPPDNEFVDRGYEYYPLRVGIERIYSVTRIEYFLGIDSATGNPVTVGDTSTFLIRELIASTEQDLSGNTIYLEHSFSKSDTSQPWPFLHDSIHQIQNNEVYLNRISNNQSRTEIRFPVQKGASWDGNAFNADPAEVYIIDSVDFPLTLDSLDFQSCIRVTKSDIENPIERDKRFEVYALGYGAVYRFKSILKYKQPIIPGAVGLERIDRGFEEIWVAIEEN